jgi:iron(III) transport system permease protein
MARFFAWALLLPLATPAYVMAYAYTDFLQFAGPLQSALRVATSWRAGEYWFPDVRSLGGAAFVLIFVLYPYVYLLARAAFLEQSSAALESARLLGHGPWRSFFRIALPLARPGIAAGHRAVPDGNACRLRTVAYFGVDTFSTGIFRAWFSLGDAVAPRSSARCSLPVSLRCLRSSASRAAARHSIHPGAGACIATRSREGARSAPGSPAPRRSSSASCFPPHCFCALPCRKRE